LLDRGQEVAAMKRALLLFLLGIAAPASAQSQSAMPEGASSGWMAISGVIMLVLVLVAVGVAVKAFDLKRRRESEAVLLQAQLSDALLRDPSLAGLLVTPTAYVPYWSGSPATVVLEGRIPSNDLREPVLRVIEREAARIRPDVVIEDHVAVVPEVARRAA
jgi:hypothetical protein